MLGIKQGLAGDADKRFPHCLVNYGSNGLRALVV
jgi:hypothetical protein